MLSREKFWSRTVVIFFYGVHLMYSQNVINRILFIFDDSYSMYAPWNTEPKINVAKKVMGRLMDSIQNIPDLEIALRCYGHTTFFRPVRNCKDSKLEIPFDKALVNAPKIKEFINKLEPKGTTPIAYSIGQAEKDFSECKNCRNIIILITDGIEECEGNPCEVSALLQKKGIFVRPFVIGIGLDMKFADALGCMGKFVDVSNEKNFYPVLRQILVEALTRTTVQVNLLNMYKKPTETDVVMSFYNSNNHQLLYNYVHTINNYGKPDTLTLDPDVEYDIEVHTLPKVVKRKIKLEKGKHNIVEIDAPQGYLSLQTDGNIGDYFPTTIVKKAGDTAILNVQDFGKTERYIVGKYDLEILTLPRIYLKDVEIKQSHTNTIKIPASGSVFISKPAKGFGSIYLDNGKTLEWVCNLDENMNMENIYLQPGRYKLEFRYVHQRRMVNTIEKTFEIKSKEVVRLILN
ncbi:MAG: VWA domain-containing protein [Bacteroidetes bacterium]|nr:MAG: VWA domain-containing protein [Bacteroidota bacterium]